MPNLIICGIGLVIALVISNSSAKKNEEKFWNERMARPGNPPEHQSVDNQASGAALFWSAVVIIVAVCLAMPHH
jgi:hypothetical protein